MSNNAVLRLAALHADRADEAASLLQDALGLEAIHPAIENAIDEFQEVIEAAIVRAEDEVTFPADSAQLLMIALKTRKLAASRPRKTANQQARQRAAIGFARARARELRDQGMRPGQADEKAAREAARYDVGLSWSTIVSRMRRSDKKVEALNR